jgi:orotate phosphoribosyltransferase
MDIAMDRSVRSKKEAVNYEGSADADKDKLSLQKRERLKEIITERALIVRNSPEIALASGLKSNFFFDMKPVLLSPEGANLITAEILKRLKDVQFDYVGGMATGSIPIVTLICANSSVSGRYVEGFFVRKEEKDHGAGKNSISAN